MTSTATTHPEAPKSTPKALVLLAGGAEEMEVVIVVDVLRRAQVEVTLAGLDGTAPVTCSRNVQLVPDTDLAAAQQGSYDVVVLPGGLGGAESLAKSKAVGALLRSQNERSAWVAAICAAPIALAAHDFLKGQDATCHPSVADRVRGHFEMKASRVVKSPGLITSQGPGTAFEFALRLVEELCGSERRDAVAGPMLLPS